MLDMNAVKNNLYSDIDKSDSKKLKEIYSFEIELLKKWDNDEKWKDIKDFIKLGFSPMLRKRCKLRFNDLAEEYQKLPENKKTDFEKDMIELINKRQSLIELLGNLFRGL